MGKKNAHRVIMLTIPYEKWSMMAHSACWIMLLLIKWNYPLWILDQQCFRPKALVFMGLCSICAHHFSSTLEFGSTNKESAYFCIS